MANAHDERVADGGCVAPRATTLLPYGGAKARRDSSPGKRIRGDHAGIGGEPKVLRMLAKHGDTRVVFADDVFKINREARPKPRKLLLSDRAVYLLRPDVLKCSARVDVADIAAVRLSTQADNFCLVRCDAHRRHRHQCMRPRPRLTRIQRSIPESVMSQSRSRLTLAALQVARRDEDAGDDLLFICRHKSEFVTSLIQAAAAFANHRIAREFCDRMDYAFASQYERTVTFNAPEEPSSTDGADGVAAGGASVVVSYTSVAKVITCACTSSRIGWPGMDAIDASFSGPGEE